MPPETDDLPESNLTRYPGSKNIPIEAIIDYRKKNLSCSQIATLLKCCPSNISRRLKTVDEAIDLTNKYRDNRGFIFAYEQNKIRQSITAADRKKAGLLEKVKSISFFHNAERLESGKSTQNIAYLDMIKARVSATTELQVIEAELVQTGVQIPVENGEVGYQEGSRNKSDDG